MRVGPSRRLSAKELMLSICAGGLLRVLWAVRRSNQSILKEINPEYSLEELMLKLKFQYFGHLLWITINSLEKTLMLGKIEGRKRRRWQRIRWLDGITYSMDMSLSKVQEIVKETEAWHVVVHGVTNNKTWLSYWKACLFSLCPRIIIKYHSNENNVLCFI